MIDLLRIKDESLEWTVPAFKCEQQKQKGKYGKYSLEVHTGKYSTQYIKKIWKLQYEFADAR